jgi:hypothetical protein
MESCINRKLNETHWQVLKVLLEDAVIANKEIAEKAFLPIDGMGSPLRRIHDFFNIKVGYFNQKLFYSIGDINYSNSAA